MFQGTTIFEIKVRDGDTGIPRKLDLSIVGDTENFFELENLKHSEDGILSASLKKTSGNTLDRELPVRQSLWQYRLLSFQAGGTKLEIFQRKLLNFEFWINGELSKIGHHFSNKVM